MQAEKIKSRLIEELTGRAPQHASGMLIGLVLSMGATAFLGSAIYVWLNMSGTAEDVSPAGFLVASLTAVLVGLVLGGIGDQMGWNQAEIDQDALACLTYDGEDALAEIGIKSWDYDRQRQAEMDAAGCALATFQFLFGTMWAGLKFFVFPTKLPEEGLRAATAVLMYLDQSGRTSQVKLTQGLSASGLAESETRRGLAFLKSRGLVVGNSEGFLLTEKAKQITSETSG